MEADDADDDDMTLHETAAVQSDLQSRKMMVSVFVVATCCIQFALRLVIS